MSERDTLPPMYAAVVQATKRLLANLGDEASYEQIGMAAWETLHAVERITELPKVLAAYARRVHDEEQLMRLEVTARDDAHTYLGEDDAAVLWDSTHHAPDVHGEIPVERQALLNVLCELELLQHRLAMRDQDGGK